MFAFQRPILTFERPQSPGAREKAGNYPAPVNHRSFNYFSPDAFAVNTVYPTDSIVKGNDEDAGYRGQVTSLRTVGHAAGRAPSPPVAGATKNSEEDATNKIVNAQARFKKEKKKRRTRRRVPVVESDIYAMSSDED